MLSSPENQVGQDKTWRPLGTATEASQKAAVLAAIEEHLPEPKDRKGLEFRAVPYSSWKNLYQGVETGFTVRLAK